MNKTGICVVGAINIDLGGHSLAPLVPGDSNPGSISISVGGVGRNIAADIARLGHSVSFITAFGSDSFAGIAKSDCTAMGLDISRALTVPGGRSSVYMYISDCGGDMSIAISDMDIVSEITPAYLESCRDILDSAGLVVFDCNLSQEAIIWLCGNVAAPLFADPVSAAKAPKLLPVMDRLHTIKPNLLEAQTLTGMVSPGDCAAALWKMGAKRAFVSLGAGGVCFCQNGSVQFAPNPSLTLIDATGAGDASTAALASAYMLDLDTQTSARYALTASAITAEHPGAVFRGLSHAAVLDRMTLKGAE